MSRRLLFLFAMLVLVAVSYNTGVQAADNGHTRDNCRRGFVPDSWGHHGDGYFLRSPMSNKGYLDSYLLRPDPAKDKDKVQEHPWDDLNRIVPPIQVHP